MTKTTTANALYVNDDGTSDLVVLDDTDCVVDVVQEEMTEAEIDAIYDRQTPYCFVGRTIEIGDGDTFRRLRLR